MSIYKKEASLEEMKREAIRRMELLKLDARTIRDFERDGSVSLSQQIGDQIFLQPSDDEISARVKRFEQGYECLVYHVLWADSPMVGECWSLLFVSPASSDWNSEREIYRELRTGLCLCGVGDGGRCQRDHGAAPERQSDPAGMRNLPDEEAAR